MAIVYALRRFHIYVAGIKFKIVTDCNALKISLDKKDVCPRIEKLCFELKRYDKTVEHRSGERMKHVDALSRMVNVMIVEENSFESNLTIKKIKEIRE